MTKLIMQKKQVSKKSTGTNSSTGDSKATSLSLMGSAFLYNETNSGNSGDDGVFLSIERTYSTQISNNTFYYNR